jgi:hypothetical protein
MEFDEDPSILNQFFPAQFGKVSKGNSNMPHETKRSALQWNL